MSGTVPVVGLGVMGVAELLGELRCEVGWLGTGLGKVGEPVGEEAFEGAPVAFEEVPVAFEEADPSGCPDAAAEAAECDGADPLHAAVSAAKAAIYISRHRFLRCDRSSVLSSAGKRVSSTFNVPSPSHLVTGTIFHPINDGDKSFPDPGRMLSNVLSSICRDRTSPSSPVTRNA
jgi:hypothetical protein